jgi:hypothetical protein
MMEGIQSIPPGEEPGRRRNAALATGFVALCTVVGGVLVFAIEHRVIAFANVAAGLAMAGIALAIHRGARPPGAAVAVLFVLSRAVAFYTEGLDTSVLFRTVVFGLILYAALRPFYAAEKASPDAVPVP